MLITTQTRLLYTGEQFDGGDSGSNIELSQYYLRARYYDPAVGRFNRMDPFAGNHSDPQSLHKYAYCHGDPINSIDPSGMMTYSSVMLTTGIIGVLIGGSVGGYIGYKETGSLVSFKTIAYTLLGVLGGFAIGVSIGALISSLIPSIGLPAGLSAPSGAFGMIIK